MTNDSRKVSAFSPRQFLKARRPERFSDSVTVAASSLDRSALEYHLETLTSRGQEKDFENFARQIAMRTICPNLLPQTGPTGGGDSKVDSETFPVSEQLALAWHTGSPKEAASERWAFAFSAKKQWRDKVRSDIRKIAETGRGYTKAIFVTNQFVPDRKRSALEDELRAKHGLDVRILDRTWILDRIFERDLEELAIKELRMTVAVQPSRRRGPLDLAREEALNEVEKRIDLAVSDSDLGHRFVDDCISAADIARQLERPRSEIEDRFARAERAASKHGIDQQRMAIAYQRAWTAYWWFEDLEEFAELYHAAEDLARSSANAHDLEQLTTLWFILRSSVTQGALSATEVKFDERTAILVEALDRLSGETGRPSSSLLARTLRLEVELLICPPGERETVLRDIEQVVGMCEGLVGYPLESLIEVVREIGARLTGSPAFDSLFERVVEVASKRQGDVTAARMLLQRCGQELDAERPYEALRYGGRALRKLAKHESRAALVRALYLCGASYEYVDLLWSARGALLNAASVAASELSTSGHVTTEQCACSNRIKWLELRLGRLPEILRWHELDRVSRAALSGRGYLTDSYEESELQFDVILGIHFLRADAGVLEQLGYLPAVLNRLGLEFAAIALLYALGQESALPPEFTKQHEKPEELIEFFSAWRTQPAADQIAQRIDIGGDEPTLHSRVLGCDVVLSTTKDSFCICLSETLLAGLEGLISTGSKIGIVAKEPRLTVDVRHKVGAEPPFAFNTERRAASLHVEVRCPLADVSCLNPEQHQALLEKALELVAHLLTQVFMLPDAEANVRTLLRDELAIDRSISFTSGFAPQANLFGTEHARDLASWREPEDLQFDFIRTDPWFHERNEAPEPSKGLSTGEGDPPPELTDPERVGHGDMRTVSLIREELWNRAGWWGVAVVGMPQASIPLGLLLIFEDAEAAELIFKFWREDLGAVDQADRLRITILRGIDKANPQSYRVLVGVNPQGEEQESKTLYMVGRVRQVDPPSDANLETFVAEYGKHGKYLLGYALMKRGDPQPTVKLSLAIEKNTIHIRHAWELGRNDIDGMALQPDDDPVVPEGVGEPPVFELLKLWREKRDKSKGGGE